MVKSRDYMGTEAALGHVLSFILLGTLVHSTQGSFFNAISWNILVGFFLLNHIAWIQIVDIFLVSKTVTETKHVFVF